MRGQPHREIPLTNVCLLRARSRSQYCTLWNEGPNASSKGDLPLHKFLAHSKDSGWFILPLDLFFPQKLSPLFCTVHKAVTHPGKKKKEGAGRRRRGKKRKFVTLHLAKARDQQQLPKAESLLSLPPGEWLPRSIQQKASFHRNWHKSGVIPSISRELLRIYGSVIQAAESCVLRATSPGFPAGDGAALLLQAAVLTVQQRRCHGLFYFSWCCHLQQMLCKQDLWRNHPLSHTAGEFWQSMTRRTFISLN